MVRTLTAIAWITLCASAQAAAAEVALPPVLRQVAFEQRLNEQVPLDLMFRDESGQSVKLGDYFTARPLILVLVQYRCPMLCNEVLNGLVRSLLDVPFAMGKDYEVVTVSFDARETP